VNDAEVENLIRAVPYPAPARDLVAVALQAQPARFPVLAWCLRGLAAVATGVLVILFVTRRTPDSLVPAPAAASCSQVFDAEGPEVRARLASAQQQLELIARPSPTWGYDECLDTATAIRTFRPTSLTRRFDNLENRLDELRLQLEEMPEPPPGPRPTTQSAPDGRRTKRRRYA